MTNKSVQLEKMEVEILQENDRMKRKLKELWKHLGKNCENVSDSKKQVSKFDESNNSCGFSRQSRCNQFEQGLSLPQIQEKCLLKNLSRNENQQQQWSENYNQ